MTQANAPTLRVGSVPEHFMIPWHLALETGAFEKAGVTIEWTDQPSGTGQMMDGLRDGSLDLAIALTDGSVKAITGGLDARIVGTYVDSPLQWGIHVAAGSAWQIDALEDARIAISRRGSGSELMAHLMADELGFDLPDERFVAVGDLAGAAVALPAGDADVFLWDRFMTSPLVRDGVFRRIGVQPTPWPAFVGVASSAALSARADELRTAWLVVSTSASLFAGRSDGPALVIDRHGLDPDIAAEWFASTTFDVAAPPDPAELADYQRRLHELGIVDAALPYDAVVTPLI